MSAAREDSGQAPAVCPTLGRFLEALDREGLRFCLLRPRATLESSEGDVDLLVEPAARDAVARVLADQGFLPMSVPGPDLHAAAYDEEAGRFVWIHVQSALRVAGATVQAEAVLAEADDGAPRQPGDAWLLWILLLRALVDKGELPERHRPHVRALAQGWTGGPALLESVARRHGLEPVEVVAAARRADWQRLLGAAVPRPGAHTGWRARLGLARARVPSLRIRPGLGVAVLGPDGAGKTTLVQALRRSLPLPTRVIYMGLTGGRLPRADSLRVPGLVLAARIAILWMRYAWSAYHRASGRIVLFERYTLDGAVPSGRPLGWAGRLSRRVQRRVCPMPDLVLLLDASGPTLHARSGEYRADVLEAWRSAYRRLEGRVPALEVIDAEQPLDRVRREAEARIWRRYAERLGSSRAR